MTTRAFTAAEIDLRHFSRLGRFVMGTVFALLFALSLLMLLRRMTGGLQQPLPSGALVAVAVLAAFLATCWRLAFPLHKIAMTNAASWTAWTLAPSIALFAFAFSISLPTSSPWAIATIWFMAVTEEGAWWMVTLRRLSARRLESPAGIGQARSDPTGRLVDPSDPEPGSRSISRELVEDQQELSPDVTQQIVRSHGPDGVEVVVGLLRGEFAAGERSQNLHIAFCPPLCGTPALTAVQLDGPAATVKAGEVESFGARLEVRLAAMPKRRQSVVVEFHARYPASAPDG